MLGSRRRNCGCGISWGGTAGAWFPLPEGAQVTRRVAGVGGGICLRCPAGRRGPWFRGDSCGVGAVFRPAGAWGGQWGGWRGKNGARASVTPPGANIGGAGALVPGGGGAGAIFRGLGAPRWSLGRPEGEKRRQGLCDAPGANFSGVRGVHVLCGPVGQVPLAPVQPVLAGQAVVADVAVVLVETPQMEHFRPAGPLRHLLPVAAGAAGTEV